MFGISKTEAGKKPFQNRANLLTIPKFGMGPLTPTLTLLEQNPLAKTVVKDIFGFNIPKILATRTPEEQLDVATLEMSNTAITLGASLTLPFLVRYPIHWVSGIRLKELSGKVAQNAVPQVKLARLGAALGFLFPFASAFWAATFFRNYLTAKRTETTNFEEIIGLEKHPSQKRTSSSSDHKRSLEEELDYQLGMTKKVLLTGLGLGLATGLGFAFSARRWAQKAVKHSAQNLSKPIDWLFKKIQLEGKNANQLSDGLATFVFWLAPAYLGWLHASRGDNELKEQALKAVNAVLWFSLFTPYGLNPLFKKPFQKITGEKEIPSYQDIMEKPQFKGLRKSLTHLKNKKFGIGLLVTILMLGLTPQLLNIYLTQRRHEREQIAETEAIRRRFSSPSQIVIRPDSPFRMFTENQHRHQRSQRISSSSIY